MDLHLWLIYLAAAVGLSLSPGPNGLLALTHGALHGRRKALFTICGGAIGFTSLIALSMFGIGALLQASLTWLTVLKWVGGAYLVWLGIQVWRSPAVSVDATMQADGRSGWSMFRQGALCAVTNPKGLLFFAAFLPQFIDPASPPLAQLIVLSVTFLVLATVLDGAYTLLAGRLRELFRDRRRARLRNRLSGSLLIGAGVGLALARR